MAPSETWPVVCARFLPWGVFVVRGKTLASALPQLGCLVQCSQWRQLGLDCVHGDGVRFHLPFCLSLTTTTPLEQHLDLFPPPLRVLSYKVSRL